MRFCVSSPSAASPDVSIRFADLGLGSECKVKDLWRQRCEGGFAVVYPEIVALDFLRGQTLSVRQTDEDAEPICGVCGGILFDGALDVGGVKVYSGETHVEKVGF